MNTNAAGQIQQATGGWSAVAVRKTGGQGVGRAGRGISNLRRDGSLGQAGSEWRGSKSEKHVNEN